MANNEKNKIIAQSKGPGYPKEPELNLRGDSYVPDSDDNSDDDDSSGGLGGVSGEIEFRFQDAMMVANRDDLLSPSEIKRLLIVQKETHKLRVDKQKATREERKALKDGKFVIPTAAQQLRGTGGGNRMSAFKKHPISDMAQFSGIDKQVIGIPNLNEADTNQELKDKLENKLENRLQNRLQNKNTPKYRPPGF
jgi:hypothetical protein